MVIVRQVYEVESLVIVIYVHIVTSFFRIQIAIYAISLPKFKLSTGSEFPSVYYSVSAYE